VAAEVVEFQHRGDTAIVSTQYSFLPSWISFIVDKDRASSEGAALLSAVRGWWDALPAADRPRLVVFGESLGSFASEHALSGDELDASLANLRGIDGALWAGPTNSNEIWRQIVAGRAAGSPAWQPAVDDGSLVRFLVTPEDMDFADPDWPTPRVAYLANPSDPVTAWEPAIAWQRPAWMQTPLGPDVPGPLVWTPFVSWMQTTIDLMNGFGAAPGHGHNYVPNFVAGWAAAAPPDGWTTADSERLQEFLGLSP
jgi:uncharacterized membrane protein